MRDAQAVGVDSTPFMRELVQKLTLDIEVAA
jgi:hypothetical protein